MKHRKSIIISAILFLGFAWALSAGTPAHANNAVFVEETGEDNPFNSLDVGSFSAPGFIDIDADGDLDAFLGIQDGTVLFYRNSGTLSSPFYEYESGSNNPLDAVEESGFSAPSFVDIDGDGDMDVFIGNADGLINFYSNSGTAVLPIFEQVKLAGNPFNGVDVGFGSAPSFVDLDRDGDMDAFIGEGSGSINFFENTGTPYAPVFTEVTGPSNPFDGVDVGDYSTPAFYDADGDGDMDAAVGEEEGSIFPFRNDGSPTSANFVKNKDAAAPFIGVDVGFYSKIAFGDVDDDGDLDAITGEGDAELTFFRNGSKGRGAVFTETTGFSTPLDGVDVVASSAVSFVDIDQDGDEDAFLGSTDGIIRYYRNNGTATTPNFQMQAGANNPFDGVDLGDLSKPSFVDIDGDGDEDAFIGDLAGVIAYYRNDGSIVAPSFSNQTGSNNPFDGVDVGDYSVPVFVDIDSDGDMDAAIGNLDGTVDFYTNGGSAAAASFSALSGITSSIDVGDISSPRFADIDGDNDMDLFVGDANGIISFFRNVGTPFAPTFVEDSSPANPFDGVDVGWSSTIDLVDIDSDGDLDAFIGESDGTFNFFRNTGNNTRSPYFVRRTGAGGLGPEQNRNGLDNAAAVTHWTGNPFDGVDVGTSSIPGFVDVDGDGDMDLFIGHSLASIFFHRNDGPFFTELFGADNPLGSAGTGLTRYPRFVDIDGDGDMDAFIGDSDGTIEFHRNDGTKLFPFYNEQTGATNPFDGVDIGSVSAPSFVDIDGDGDNDALIGNAAGDIDYYRNDGTAGSPTFVLQSGTDNPFNGVDVGATSTPSFGDLDHDGDQDAFIGEYYGEIFFFKNMGTSLEPLFIMQGGVNNPLDGVYAGNNPALELVDLDEDGDLDIFSGAVHGRIYAYENVMAQDILLETGWNLISLFVDQGSQTMSGVLADVAPDTALVKNAAGEVYWPEYNVDQIGDWQGAEGYLIYMNSMAALHASGDKIDTVQNPISLSAGWNNFAYPRRSTMDVDTALDGISSNLLLVKDSDGHVYWPAMAINTIGDMQPGKGYQAYMGSADDLSYPFD